LFINIQSCCLATTCSFFNEDEIFEFPGKIPQQTTAQRFLNPPNCNPVYYKCILIGFSMFGLSYYIFALPFNYNLNFTYIYSSYSEEIEEYWQKKKYW